MKLSKISKYFYSIIQANNGPNGKPLPNMKQYYLSNQDKKISFWNDIDINIKGDIITACIQIPKQISNKLEVKKKIENHPIMQDTKNNVFTKEMQLRYYAQFPLFNYGFIPQTWQQNITPDSQGRIGDDDPIDICDLSKSKKEIGSIYRAKILGCFCLIDQGQIDWKILLIDQKQASNSNIKSLNDFSKQYIQSILKWFKTIKVFDGKKQNKIQYNDKIFTVDETIQIITDTHQEWIKLINDKSQVYQKIRQKFHINSPL